MKLPAGATLYVDDKKSPSKEAVRQFATPPLPANREFAYLLKAEVMRDGRPETVSQKVSFRAGERLTVDLTGFGKWSVAGTPCQRHPSGDESQKNEAERQKC